MSKAGGIIGIIAGIFGVLAALVTLLFGGLGSAFAAKGASTVIGLGWGGVAFSFLAIVFGAVAMSRPKGAGLGLILTSVAGAILGGSLVAICMVLALIGGVLCLAGAGSNARYAAVGVAPGNVDDTPVAQGTMPRKNAPSWPMAIVGVFTILFLAYFLSVQNSGSGTPTSAATDTTAGGPAQTNPLDTLANSPASGLRPEGELAAMFNMMSDNTELQRENKLKEIKGQVVEWSLPVYEVKKDDDGYEIQTTASGGAVGTFVHVTPRTPEDRTLIEGLKTGNMVSVKGIIEDESLRHLVLRPAIIYTLLEAAAPKADAVVDAPASTTVPEAVAPPVPDNTAPAPPTITAAVPAASPAPETVATPSTTPDRQGELGPSTEGQPSQASPAPTS